MTVTRPHLRWLIRRDLSDVLEIERASYKRPWTEETFLHHLRQRMTIGIVAELDNRVIGYCFYEYRPKSLRIVNLTVAAGFRRCGIARAFVDKLKCKVDGGKRDRLRCVVREHDLQAQLFLRRMRFKCEVLRGHYDEPKEDGYLFVWRRS